MGISDFLIVLKEYIGRINVTLVDFFFFILFFAFFLEETLVGALSSFLNLLSIATSFFLGLILYTYPSHFLREKLALSKGTADGFSLFLLCFSIWMVVHLSLLAYEKMGARIKINKKIDRIGGGFFALPSLFFLSCVLVAVTLSLPVSSYVKDQITQSMFGKFIMMRLLAMESNLQATSGGEREEMLNFLTIQPFSTQIVFMNTTSYTVLVDRDSELEIVSTINHERQLFGVKPMVSDTDLGSIARSRAEDMIRRGYFSHVSPEGYTLFDDLEIAGIVYQFAISHIAYSPNVEIVLNRFLADVRQREYLLGAKFKRIGAGVMDGNAEKVFVIVLSY